MQTLQLFAILGLVLSCLTTTLLAGNLMREQFGTVESKKPDSEQPRSAR